MALKKGNVPTAAGQRINARMKAWSTANPGKFLTGSEREEFKKFIESELLSCGYLTYSQDDIANMSLQQCEDVLGTTLDSMPNIQMLSNDEKEDMLRSMVLEERRGYLERQVNGRIRANRPIVQEQVGSKRKLGESTSLNPDQTKINNDARNPIWNPITHPINNPKTNPINSPINNPIVPSLQDGGRKRAEKRL